MKAPVRRKRVWTVADFAQHAYGESGEPACRRARRFLKRLDAKHGGRLLTPTPGANRGFTLIVAALAKLEPDLFEPIESLEFRVDDLEDAVDSMKLDQKDIVSQVRQNSRSIAKMRSQLRLPL